MLDRAGAVPNDGVTHQGIFDISLFRPVPDLYILSPSTALDLKLLFEWAINFDKPVVIRYPKKSCPEEIKEISSTKIVEGRGVLVKSSLENKKRILVVSTGGMYSEVQKAVDSVNNIPCDIYLLRFIKPFDFKYFLKIAGDYYGILFVEDGIKIGGISEYIVSLLNDKNIMNTKILAFEDKYYEHGTRDELLQEAGLSTNHIVKQIKECYK